MLPNVIEGRGGRLLTVLPPHGVFVSCWLVGTFVCAAFACAFTFTGSGMRARGVVIHVHRSRHSSSGVLVHAAGGAHHQGGAGNGLEPRYLQEKREEGWVSGMLSRCWVFGDPWVPQGGPTPLLLGETGVWGSAASNEGS